MPVPRISGTAMPHGVFLSTGTASTAGLLSLFATGFSIVGIGVLAAAPTYVLLWLADQYLHLSLPAVLLQIGGPADPTLSAIAHILVNLLTFLIFLLVLRATPLAGYHSAEHMTVHAIEHYGVLGWEPFVEDMPRAHRRCGSNLLSGILPILLVGAPLVGEGSPMALALAAIIAILGWRVRHYVGFFIQNTFTTKPPTEHQLACGIDAGQRLMAQWLAGPPPVLSPARRWLRRGLPQMVAGVTCAIYLMSAVTEQLYRWLDW